MDVLTKLRQKCRKFDEALAVQKGDGLEFKEEFRWVSALVNAGQAEAAEEFFGMGVKKEQHRDERLMDLIENADPQGGPTTRCSTFGCSRGEIEACWGTVRENGAGEVTNTPANFVRKKSVEPPEDPAFDKYVEALADVPDYAVNSKRQIVSVDDNGNALPLANFVARPTLQVVRDDGYNQQMSIRVEGLLDDGSPLPPVDLPADEFLKMDWVVSKWGAEASIKPGSGRKDKLRDALQNAARGIPRHIVYTHLGWHKLDSGKYINLHSGGAVGAEGISVEIEEELAKYRLPKDVKDLRMAAKASLSLLGLAPRRVTMPLLALVYLSPLCECFRRAGCEPTFVLWLIGTTGVRKTSLGMVFQCHFGNFGTKSPPASFESTANALERLTHEARDVMIMVDDYHPEETSSDGQRIASIAKKLLRRYGDRVARSRMRADTTLMKSLPPKGMALVTGEDAPQGHSTVARFFEVELLKDEVDLGKLTKAQLRRRRLAEAMRGYVEWLSPRMDRYASLLGRMFHRWRTHFQSMESHGRAGESAAWLFVAYMVMLKYMVHAGACDRTQASALKRKARRLLGKLVRRQKEVAKQEKPAEIFLRVLGQLFATKKVRVEPLKTNPGHSFGNDSNGSGEKIGWSDDKFLYLMPEVVYNKVNEFLNRRGKHIPVTERLLWRHLDEAGAIRTEIGSDGEVQRCMKKTVPSEGMQAVGKQNRPRCLYLRRSALNGDFGA